MKKGLIPLYKSINSATIAHMNKQYNALALEWLYISSVEPQITFARLPMLTYSTSNPKGKIVTLNSFIQGWTMHRTWKREIIDHDKKVSVVYNENNFEAYQYHVPKLKEKKKIT